MEGSWGLTRNQKKEIEATRDLYKNNFELFCKNELHIIDRDDPSGVAVKKFKWNVAQKKLNETVELIKLYNLRRSRELNKENPSVPVSEFPVEVVILKPRKVGISTWLQGRSLWRSEMQSNINCLIMAHELDSAKNIVAISQRFINLWEEGKCKFRKTIDSCVDNKIVWGSDPVTGKPWSSQIIVKTGGTRTKGTSRGYTYHFVHISEEAHFQSDSEVASSLAATVPFKETYEESTANGLGGMFYENFNNAAYIHDIMEGRVPPDWNGKFKFFFSWIDDPDYSKAITPVEAEAIKNTLSPREKDLIERFKCTTEQLAWRRYKIRGECSNQSIMDPEDYFNQEYPTEPVDAFVTSGTGAFALKPLTSMAFKNRMNPKPAWQGNISPAENGECYLQETTYESTCTMFKLPEPGCQYIMGVDTAEGLLHGDDSVISVWWRKSYDYIEEVARIIGKFEADELSTLAIYMAKKYNEAFIVPEANGQGSATTLFLQKSGYPFIYIRENPHRMGDTDQANTFVFGFMTNRASKPMLVASGQQAVREGKLWIRSKVALRQWELYRNVGGKFQAPTGEKDDCVMADLLAVWAHFSGSAPLSHKYMGPDKNNPDPKIVEMSDEIKASWEKINKIKRAHQASRMHRPVVRPLNDALRRFF